MRFELFGIPLMLACSTHHSANADAAPGTDGFATFEVENNVEVLTNALLAGSGNGVALASDGESELATLDVGDASKAFFFPRGCLSTTHDPSAHKVTYTFAGCTGPRGLAKLTGTYIVAYETTQGELALEITSDGLKINGATISTRANATIRTSALSRTMDWKASANGTSRSGVAISRTVKRTLRWTVGTPCISVDGSSEGSYGGSSLQVVVSNLTRCRASCPEAGGTIKLVNAEGTYVLSFDGSNLASLDGPNGKESIALGCTR